MSEVTKKHCSGCYNNDYNYGLGGSNQCWSLESAKLIKRRRVHINDIPPWNHKPELLPDCYRKPQYVFVNVKKGPTHE